MSRDDTFAICPEGGYPRLFRFDITDDNTLSELDPKQNLLRINKYLFDRLPEHLQHEVYKTKALVLTLNDL